MAVTHPYMSENVWFDKARCEDAEADFYSGKCGQSVKSAPGSIASEIARAREQIQKALNSDGTGLDNTLITRIENIELENKELRQATDDLRQIIKNLENRISTLEVGNKSAPAPVVADNKQAEADDEDFELFGSDDEEENAAAEKLKEERLAAYAAKKSKKPVLIAKSNVILDVKPWDDETDMAELEKHVRSIVMDGLLWGASKFVAVGYGIKKLQICTVIVDDKVSVDELEEKITDFEDFVQSVDIAAFNKI